MFDGTKGWQCEDYDFDEVIDAALDIDFEYEGHEYTINPCCIPGKVLIIRIPENEIIKTFESKEDFYTGKLFGKSMKEIIDDSVISWIS